jgi:membrane protease YdiL (CAAX protease family)
VGGLLLSLLATALVAIGAGAAGADLNPTPKWVTIVSTFLQDGCFIVAALGFAATRGRPRAADFGAHVPRRARSVLWVALAAVVFVGFSAGWSALIDNHQTDNLPNQLGANVNVVSLAFVALLVAVVAPIAEETLFRGLFFTSMRTWIRALPAAVVTGLVFGAVHVGSAPVVFLVPLAFFGFVLCLLRWFTGSLYPCIALHAINNAVAFGVTEGWGWQIPVTVVGALAVITAILLPIHRLWHTLVR